MKRLIRVFPRRTQATPDDSLAFVGNPTLLAEADEVHVSVIFTYDRNEGERLAERWKYVSRNVSIGGPAYNDRGNEFVPGKYVKQGYVITSRGCPNNCWFCSVPKREGRHIRCLPLTNGWNVLDDNLLACPEHHIRGVFEMLKRQTQQAQFTGGLEAAALKSWHVDLLKDLNPKQMFFAYDTPDDYEPLVSAGRMLLDAGFTFQSKKLRCYVLCGFPKDTIEKAEKRMWQTLNAGFWPMAMLYRSVNGVTDKTWAVFQRSWARPAAIYSVWKKNGGGGYLKS